MHVQTWLSLSFVPLAPFLSFWSCSLIKQSENTYLSGIALLFHWYPLNNRKCSNSKTVSFHPVLSPALPRINGCAYFPCARDPSCHSVWSWRTLPEVKTRHYFMLYSPPFSIDSTNSTVYSVCTYHCAKSHRR